MNNENSLWRLRAVKSRNSLLIIALLASGQPVWAAGDLPTEFINNTTIGNTRHNLSQRQTNGGAGNNNLNASLMDPYRNNYDEVCVYCHTPHGANTTIAAPLWNRTANSSTTYTVYNQANLTGNVTSPGANSLTCLSCHDGTTAIDSIVNMPGSGRHSTSQMTSQNNAFLNTWPSASSGHRNLGPSSSGTSCLVCHSPEGLLPEGATDFTVFALGTDLTNDHPIGVNLPTDPSNWNIPGGTKGTTKYFDEDGNSQMTKNEIRLYNTGQGPEVECASCHDPHGVPSSGAGSQFNPTFLRKANTGSAVCLTCHNK